MHDNIISDYQTFIESFINIRNDHIRKKVTGEISSGKLWPQPLIQFNPSFKPGMSVDQMIADGIIHDDFRHIFKGFQLFEHQVEAITLGSQGKDFIVTSGTGSGKSLTYLGTIFNHLLQNKSEKGIKAIIIYPMNALINSQNQAIEGLADKYQKATGKEFPISFAQYTGQEDASKRDDVHKDLPDILLTNYMMLELILTRLGEEDMRRSIYQSLKYLVFDELHTYRGRQGSDVAMLIRRIKAKCQNPLSCIGTSATMISGGNLDDQKEKVAQVASTVFGSHFEKDQIVIESLIPSLSQKDNEDLHPHVKKEIEKGINPESGYDQLIINSLAKWLEKHIALRKLEDGTIVRNNPMTFKQISESLVEYSGLSYAMCQKAVSNLLNWIAKVNLESELSEEKSILPFKLHQFISQTGSVYMTLDRNDKDKLITLQAGVFVSIEGSDKKPIYPVVFSRESGHEFICVTRNTDTKRLDPREFSDWNVNEEEEGEGNLAGYIIVGEDIWDDDQIKILPDAWLNPAGDRVIAKYRPKMPKKIWFNEFGQYSETLPLEISDWTEGWFMPYKLLFDPTSGTFYDTRTSEGTKLTKLGSEGRSTSTTILSFNILRELAEAGYDYKKQKVLSFTDNRQDAALQSGHFNDFFQTLHLRAGINKAVHESEKGYLEFAEIGEAIFKALDLEQEEYAISIARFPGPLKDNENTLKDFLTYKVLYDLRRSWRVVLPNLEQCGLLKIRYKHFDENLENPEFINDLNSIIELEKEERLELVHNTLDFFRKTYAIRSTEFLEGNQIEVKRRNIRQKLKHPWTFEEDEQIPVPNFMRYDVVPRHFKRFTESIGYSSGYGRYLRYLIKEKTGEVVGRDLYIEIIVKLLDLLDDAGWLNSESVVNAKGDNTKIYQLNIDQVIWEKANEDTIQSDPIKTRSYKKNTRPSNKFFKQVYQVDFKKLKKLEAADHTGQITKTELRQQRENLFKEGDLSALFCSPTMELGVDISTLDIVHMRNVPPSPANYAQRSGRAGRSGQAALIFTYCSAFSPHDRNYFKNSIEMVSGSVAPPRLDLINQELLKTHINAIYLAELGLGEITRSISDIVDEDDAKDLKMRDEVRHKILNASSITLKEDVERTFLKVIADFKNQLENDKIGWFGNKWISHVISSFYAEFDLSLNRWRTLFKAARNQLDEATSVIKSGLYSVNSQEYKEAERNQQQATRQLSQLRNDERRSFSEFYPFRYFASEGFLPGYNFTRLPIRTYLQSGSVGEFISRPRFIALREFGPRNIIYHNGAKFSIEQLIQKQKLSIVKAKVSKKSGYFLDRTDFDADTCPLTNNALDNDNNRKYFINLVEMAETRGVQRDRISCDEEERASQGFDIDTYFSVPAGIHTITKAKALVDGQPLLNIHYMPSARLVQINTKWRKSREDSFKIGVQSGFWRSHNYEPPEDGEEIKKVQLYTWDTADSLYIQPIKALGLSYEGIITLMYALKRAIELEFQVEPREIGVSQMGDKDNPNIFIYESAEGSLGILSQVVEDISIFNKLIRRAIEVCRYHDPEYTAPASYDDLLSYYNQRHHLDIDRFLIKEKLDVLDNCNIEVQSGLSQEDYETQYQMLLRRVDKRSQTELKFLEFLYKNNYRLPDSAQEKHEDIYVMPDFYYERERTWIFCDGTPHDDPAIKERDKKQREAILNKGEFYWVFYYKDKLEEKIKERPDIFKKIR